ncbi:hypothetical protein Ancab_005551 [Ancistrocladus abbreviatus]
MPAICVQSTPGEPTESIHHMPQAAAVIQSSNIELSMPHQNKSRFKPSGLQLMIYCAVEALILAEKIIAEKAMFLKMLFLSGSSEHYWCKDYAFGKHQTRR